jgi:hypothetical protein
VAGPLLVTSPALGHQKYATRYDLFAGYRSDLLQNGRWTVRLGPCFNFGKNIVK